MPCLRQSSSSDEGTDQCPTLQEEELNRAKEQVAKEMEQLKNTLNARQLEMARLSTLIENYTVQSEDILKKVETCVSIIPTWKDLLEQGTLKTLCPAIRQAMEYPSAGADRNKRGSYLKICPKG